MGGGGVIEHGYGVRSHKTELVVDIFYGGVGIYKVPAMESGGTKQRALVNKQNRGKSIVMGGRV